MKVILTDNIVRVGVKGDLVDVKPGCFRNYLDRKRIEEVEKIDGVGEFVINARLYEGVNADLKVIVVAEVE